MKTHITLLISFFLLSCSQSQTPQHQTISEKITVEQSGLIDRHTKIFPEKTQLSLAIIENGGVKFIGVERISDTMKVLDNQQNIFEIGSISKVFTSVLLANFIDKQMLSLDSHIQDLLPFPIKTEQTITLKHLANHTAGLPRLPTNMNLATVDPLNPYKEYSEQKLKEYLTQQVELTQDPGKKYAYSNLGAGLLGYILSQQAQKDYEYLLNEYIFDQYKMTNSSSQRQKLSNKMIKGLNAEGQEVPNWDLSVLVGAGGILSTTEDLSKFALAQFNTDDKVLELARKPTFTVNKNLDIALGWHILNKGEDGTWHWHNGGTGGYTSSMAIDMDKKNAVIILSNVSAFNPKMGNIDTLCFALMKTLLNK